MCQHDVKSTVSILNASLACQMWIFEQSSQSMHIKCCQPSHGTNINCCHKHTFVCRNAWMPFVPTHHWLDACWARQSIDLIQRGQWYINLISVIKLKWLLPSEKASYFLMEPKNLYTYKEIEKEEGEGNKIRREPSQATVHYSSDLSTSKMLYYYFIHIQQDANNHQGNLKENKLLFKVLFSRHVERA